MNEEVKEIIGRLRNGKAVDKEGINIELVRNIWKKEEMLREWETGQIVTQQKMEINKYKACPKS